MTGLPLDLDPSLLRSDGLAETTVQVSTGCATGGHVEVWTVVGGGHIRT